jgi:hypothetical protein
MIKQLFAVALLLFIFACEDASKLEYNLPDQNYEIKISFVVEDGTLPATLFNHVDSIIYKISTFPNDSNDIKFTEEAVTLDQKILLTDDRYNIGLYSGIFAFKDAHGTDLYSRAIAADTIIRKEEDRPLEWRVKLKRNNAVAAIVLDSMLHTDFANLSAIFYNDFMDSVAVDTIIPSSLTILNTLYSGEYNVSFKASFVDANSNLSTRDTVFSSFHLSSDTILFNLTKMISE